MRIRAAVRSVVVSAVLFLTGCGLYTAARVTVNDPITAEDVAFIEPGKTSFREVIARLGTPDELSAVEHGAVVTYHFRDARYSRVNLGWPLRFFIPVQPDLILGGGGLGTDLFQVTFDQHWIAQRHAFARHVETVRRTFWPF